MAHPRQLACHAPRNCSLTRKDQPHAEPAYVDRLQEHFDRIVAAFPGDDLTAKANAYKAWLTNNLIDEVERAEVRQIDAATNADKAAKLAALTASLPPRVEYPPK